MPYHTTVIDNGRGMYCRGSGQMLGQEVIAAMQKANSQWVGPIDYMIVDLRNLDVAVSSVEERRAVLELEVEFSKGHPDVVLIGIATTDLQFGIARMWEQMLEPTGWSVQATLGAEEARECLQTRLAAMGRPPAGAVIA